jgi:hypothetical protein
MGQVGNWVFKAFFIAWGWRCLCGANRCFLWGRNISLGPPAVRPSSFPTSVIALTAVRDRDKEVYSVTASCWQGEMKGPTASGLTTRRIIEGTAIVGHFHFHQGHL